MCNIIIAVALANTIDHASLTPSFNFKGHCELQSFVPNLILTPMRSSQNLPKPDLALKYKH